jgi:hypothetical protein
MANNLLMLIILDTHTMAFMSLLVSVVGALAAIFAAFYANIAVFYAKKAATKRDLTPVEQNTQHVGHFNNKIPRHRYPGSTATAGSTGGLTGSNSARNPPASGSAGGLRESVRDGGPQERLTIFFFLCGRQLAKLTRIAHFRMAVIPPLC